MVQPYDDSQDSYDMITAEENSARAREERRRTGRYLALGIAIFLLLLGFYHAIAYKAMKNAALLGTVLVMFLYLLWLLYASNHKKKVPEDMNNAELGTIAAEEPSVTETKSITSEIENVENGKLVKTHKTQQESERNTFKRTYSIA